MVFWRIRDGKVVERWATIDRGFAATTCPEITDLRIRLETTIAASSASFQPSCVRRRGAAAAILAAVFCTA